MYCPVNKREKSHENKRLCFGVEPGHSSLQMGFEPPIEESPAWSSPCIHSTLGGGERVKEEYKTVDKSQDEGECNSDNALQEGP